MRLATLVAATAALIAFAPALAAQDRNEPETVIEKLFTAAKIDQNWFAPAFLSQVPAQQVADIVSGLEDRFGTLKSVNGSGQRFTVVLERAEVPTRLVLDDEGRIAGLLFKPAVAGGSLDRQMEAINALPGETAVLVTREDEDVAAHNAESPLAVGSTAKLAVLKALDDAIAAGRLARDEVVDLKSGRRSLPSGILQDWPDGTPVTVATLANLMISVSDNTATDALIALVGREAVEAASPRNAPFPTTRELFTLKVKGNEALRRAWVDGDSQARRGILEQIADAPLPEAAALPSSPTIDVEWHFSLRELCALMTDLAENPALHINPGVAEPEHWESVAFKGGSETGVINLTTLVENAKGERHCVAATWNRADAPLNEEDLVSSYRAILRNLRPQD